MAKIDQVEKIRYEPYKPYKSPPVVAGSSTSCDGTACLVAVSTLASAELAGILADRRPEKLCMVGKTETENLGIENVIKNMLKNPMIRVLLVVGKEPEGHYTGKTFLALSKNGVDKDMRVIGSPGKRPVLRNITRDEVDVFRKHVQVVDMIGCEDVERIIEKVEELSNKVGLANSCSECREGWTTPVQNSIPPLIKAKAPAKTEMDSAGYFVITPQQEKGIIVVEHYSYDNKCQRVIEGKDARSIYQTIIENGWVTQLSHAAYLGRELANAQMSIEQGFRYVQDG